MAVSGTASGRRSRHLAVGLAAVVALAVGIGLILTGGDDDPAPDEEVPTVDLHSVTSVAPDPGGLQIPELPGTVALPVPDLGFGIAIPTGWDATLLTEDALDRVRDASLDQPAFLDAAEGAASTGAVFYAAGVERDGAVGDLKIDVQDGVATDPVSLRAMADELAASGVLSEAIVVVGDDGRVRIDYRIGGGDVAAVGSQLLVPDGDRLWSLIVTSESEEAQGALLTIFEGSFVLD